jgi:hypothetical protein
MITEMAIDVRNLLSQAVEIAWFSRGSIQYHYALLMTPLERDVAIQFYTKRIESQKQSAHPVY